MKQIKKLRDLSHTESFLQINFKKGFRYIDTAGSIVNLFTSDDGSASYSMDAQKLIIPNPSDNIDQLRISVGDFWCHFPNPDKFTESHTQSMATEYSKLAQDILEVTEPSSLTRVGWRAYLLLELTQKVESLNKVFLMAQGKIMASVTELQAGDAKVTVQLRLLEKKDGGSSALLFDVDTYLDEEGSIDEIRERLEIVRSAFFSGVLLSYINSVIKAI